MYIKINFNLKSKHAVCLILIMASILLIASNTLSQMGDLDPWEMKDKITKGIGVLVSYGTVSSQFPAWIERDAEVISDAGFQSIRIPLKVVEFSNNFTQDLGEDFFGYLDEIVEDCRAKNIAVAMVMESGAGNTTKEKFAEYWWQIASHYKEYSQSAIVFDLLNEPELDKNSPLGKNPDLLNEYMNEAITAIRMVSPKRYLLAGSIDYNAAEKLKLLDLPKDDIYILGSIHIYRPFSFTHAGYGGGGKGWPWDGCANLKNRIDIALNDAKRWSDDTGRPVIITEFGATDKCNQDDRIDWTYYVRSRAELKNIGWVVFSYTGPYAWGLFDVKDAQRPIAHPGVVNCLFNPVPPPGLSENIALKKKVTVSSKEHSEKIGSNLNDGDIYTRWASEGQVDIQWVEYDLGETYKITGVNIEWESADAKSYQIQVSDNGGPDGDWSDIYSTTEGDGGRDSITGLSGKGRYIRLFMTERGTDWGYSVWEFAVFADTTTPDAKNTVEKQDIATKKSGVSRIAISGDLISGLTTHGDFLPVDFSVVTGAQIDESVVEVILYVDVMAKPGGNGSQEEPFQTITQALEAVTAFLKQEKPTRVVIQPGTYREGELNIPAQGKASYTLLIIEAAKPGSVVISGSDAYASDTWKPVMDEMDNIICYEHPWPYDFGFNPGGWKQNNPKYPYEHRSELAFVNGKPLRQIMLEVYEYKPPESKPFPEDTIIDPYPGVPQDINKHGIYTYVGMTDPEKLPPGSFGIAERDENGNRIYLRPPEGIQWNKAKIEVSVRRYLLWSKYKSNLVLRGLIFQHCAGPIESYGTVMIGRWWPEPEELTNRNILIEDCTFRYNNNNQLSIRYSQDVMLRRCRALYGAYGGITMDTVQNVLWEDTESSFNNWRVSGGWASGGIKIHNTLDMITRGHRAIGNDGVGLWYDISCGNVLVDSLIAIGNRIGLDWEISRGLHVRNSLFSANLQASVAIVSGSQVLMENNLMYGSPGLAHLILIKS
ncbi:cellulase family glycosylhydrolase [Candidatus Poribacteria bacterium]|nr:cellulase family glycosylhydrolase [Candidatus Poribacteria bacterium]